MAATTFDTFGCNVANGQPATPDLVAANVTFNRRGFDIIHKLMPDGVNLEFWSLRDANAGTTPAATIRLRQNQIAHTVMGPTSGGTHTIHHHGIEPTPMNDGVGHTSFEVSGTYTYQWRPAYAGTYFYHCHKNTTLHFENGMYGPLIVDPASGLKRVYDPAAGDTNSVDTTYDVEAIWAVDDVDPVFHNGIAHDAGLCGQDAGLNNFRPLYFMINGVGHPTTLTDSRAVVNMTRNQRLLIRLINASYSVVYTTITGLNATIVGIDGRALRTNAALGDFSSPIALSAGTPLISTSAQRYDLLIVPTVAGTYTVQHEFRQWITGTRDTRAGGPGIAQTVIRVT